MQLSAEQRKQIDEFETDASAKFEKSLSDDRRTKLKDLQKNVGPFGPPVRRTSSTCCRRRPATSLELSAEQAKLVDDIQQQAAAKLKAVLKDDQANQLKSMQDMMKAFAGGPPGGGGPVVPAGHLVDQGGGPGGFLGFGGGNFNGGSSIFRALSLRS